MTKIVNIKNTKKYDIYCGRDSIYGNPFIIGIHGDRKKCIALYKKYFYDKIKKDDNFKNEILKLENKTLGCYCKPEDCHCDIFLEYLESLWS